MPVPYVDVGSDILKSYMAGRQMMIAQQQMAMEQQRIAEERRMHDMQNMHYLQQLEEEHQFHQGNLQIAQSGLKRQMAMDAAEQARQFTEDVSQRKQSLPTSVLPTPDTQGNAQQFAQQVGATPLSDQTSPAAITQGVIDQSPNNPQAIAGTPVQGPNPTIPAPQGGVAPVTQGQVPGQDIKLSLGGVIPAQQAANIPIIPSPEDKIKMETAARIAESEAAAQSMAKANKPHWDLEHEDAVARTKASLMEAMARIGETQFQHESQRRAEATKIFGTLQQSPFAQNIVPQIAHGMGIVEDIHKTNGEGYGPGTGLSDADAVDTLRQLKGFKAPFGNPKVMQDYLKALLPNAEKWIQNFKGLTDPGNAVFNPEGRRAMANLIEKTAREQNTIWESNIKSAEKRARGIWPNMPDNYTEGFTERFNLEPELK